MKKAICWNLFASSILLLLPLATPSRAGLLQVPNQYPTIQAAIVAAQNGDVVLVNIGTYNQSINFLGKAITVTSTNPFDNNIVDDTKITGNGTSSVIFESGETNASVLIGFTIEYGTGKLDSGFLSGGGVFCKNSSPLIDRCVIRFNTAYWGAGVYCNGGSPLIQRCRIRQNGASQHGGGVMLALNTRAEIRNCIITNNYVTNVGAGGIYCFACTAPNVPVIRSNVIAGNIATARGSGISCNSASPIIINNLILLNRGGTGTAGLFREGTSNPYCCRNDLFTNLPADVQAGFPACAQGNLIGTPGVVSTGQWLDLNGTPGNILDDAWLDGNYALTAGAASMDAGDVTVAWPGEATDYAGVPRFMDDRCKSNTSVGTGLPIDIGAYEYPSTVVGSTCNFWGVSPGIWNFPDNWSTGQVPNCNNSPTIITKTVNLAAANALSDLLTVNNGSVLNIQSGASLTANDLFVSQSGAACTLTQSASEVRIEGMLSLSGPLPGGSINNLFPNATYVLSGGALRVSSLRLGHGRPANGLFQQSAGTCEVVGQMSLAKLNDFGNSSVGRYELTGGTLTTGSALIGDKLEYGRGEILVQNATWTNIGSCIVAADESYGLIDVRTGGSVIAQSGIVLNGNDGGGTIKVDGAGANLNAVTKFNGAVGGTFPTAFVEIRNGGVFTSGPVLYGGSETVYATTGGIWNTRITIDGAGSQWNCTDTFTLGGTPRASLNPSGHANVLELLNGGTVAATTFRELPFGQVFGTQGTLQGNIIILGTIQPGVYFTAPATPTVGTLTIQGSTQFTGIWNPGPPFGVNPFETSGAAIMHIGGTNPGVTHDRLNFNGQFKGGGKLDLRLINGYVPSLGTQFVLGTYQDFLAPFALVQSPAFPDDRFIVVSYAPTVQDGNLFGSSGTIVATVVNSSTLVGFDTPISETLGGVPTDQVVRDFDGINGPDIALCIPNSVPTNPGTVVILLNQGSSFTVAGAPVWQGFAIVGPFPVGVGPVSIVTDDYDGANGPDIAVANQTAGTISVLLRTAGPGVTFSAPNNIAAGTQPRALASADINGDLIFDIVRANPGATANDPATITVMQGSGGGGFPTAFSLPVGDLPITVDPSDVDNDRDVDLLLVSTYFPPPETPGPPQGQAGVIINGSGLKSLGISLAPPVYSLIGGVATSMTQADLNNDKLPDIIVNNIAANTLSYALNDGGGTFQGFVGLALGATPDAVAAGDFNGDGSIDVATVLPGGGGGGDDLKPFPNLLAPGQQQVQFDPTQAPNPLDGDSILIATADFDGDGSDDVVTINTASPLSGIAGTPPTAGVLLNNSPFENCPGDIAPLPSGNDMVNVDDLLAVINAWGPCANPSNCPADIAPPPSGNDVVNVDDLLAVINAWGACP